jgi:hypothetical protein
MSSKPKREYPIFTITSNGDGTYNWTLWSVNARPLMSEVDAAMELAKLVEKLYTIKTHVDTCHFNRQKHHDNAHYFFDQVSDNPFEVLHRSKLYQSMQAVDRAKVAVQRDAPQAPIIYIEDKQL